MHRLNGMLDLRKLRKRGAARGALSSAEPAGPDGAGNAATRSLTETRPRLCPTIPPPPAAVHGAFSSWTATTPTPKWLVATIAPGDVRPAGNIKLAIPDLDEVTQA